MTKRKQDTEVEDSPLPSTKHVKSEHESQVQQHPTLPSGVQLNSGTVRFENLSIEQNDDTHNLNRLAAIWNDLSIAPGKGKYTPLKEKVKHVLDWPIHRNRNYQLVGHPELIPAAGSNQSLPAWKFTVKDLNNPKSRGFTPFRAQPSGFIKNRAGHWRNPGAYYLGLGACPTADDVKQLCDILCEALNRTPWRIPEAQWQVRKDVNGGNRPICRFVEITACMKYNPAFDFREWNTITGEKCTSGGILGLLDYRLEKKRNGVLTTGGNSIIIGLEYGPREPDWAFTSFSAEPKDVLVDKVAGLTLPTFPEKTVASVKAKAVKENVNTPQFQQAERVVRHQFVSMIGYIGTRDQFQAIPIAIRDQFHTQHTTRRIDGVLDEAAFLVKPDPRSGGHKFGAGAADALRHPDVPVPVEKKSNQATGQKDRFDRVAPAEKALHELLKLNSGSYSRVLNAWADEHATQVFIHRSKLFPDATDALKWGILALCEALDSISLLKINVPKVLSAQCQCDENVRKTMPHICQFCFRLQNCKDMLEDDQQRRICGGCVEKSGADILIKDVRLRIKLGLTQALQLDHDAGVVNVPSISGMTNALQPSIIDDYRWQDMYGKAHDIRDAMWSIGTGPHPRVCSVEKSFGLFVDSSGDVFLHHMDNIGLTLDCINRLKGTALPACLLVFKCMLELRKATSGVFAGYHPEQAKFWEVLERACDNEWKIRHAYVARSPRHRTTTEMTRQEFEHFCVMAKSLVWDGEVPLLSRQGCLSPTVRAEIALQGKHPFTMCSEDDLTKLKRLINQLEASPFFNPHGMKIPRSKDGSPWFWRKRDRGSFGSWELVWFECAGRLKTMLKVCDPDNDHEESPMSLLLEFVVQWFKTGGKCHLFGMMYSLFANHLQSLSIGRGVYYLDASGRPTNRFIKPGAPMATGWPANFSEITDYDPTRCTIVFESWKANTYRYKYRVGPELLPMLEAIIEDIANVTPYYDPLEMNPRKYCKVDLAADFEETWCGYWLSSKASGAVGSITDLNDEDSREQEETERDAIGNVIRLSNDSFQVLP